MAVSARAAVAADWESYVPLSSWFRSYGTNKKQEDWWEATLYRRVFPLPDAMLQLTALFPATTK